MLLGSVLALLSTMTFAMNGAAVRRGMLTGTVTQALAVTVPFGVPLFFLPALATGHLGAITEFSSHSVILLATAGILHFVWGRYCNFRAIKAIGGNASALLQQMDFPLKVGLAIAFLGETLTPIKIFGIGLIMLGSMIGIRQSRRPLPAAPDISQDASSTLTPKSVGAAASEIVFKPRYAEGYTCALLSVTGYGVSPLFIRMALQDAGIGASLTGGLISYMAATLVIMLMWIKPGQLQHVLSVHRPSAKWFGMSALFVGFSQMFQYMALAVAPITVVAPIQRSAALFRMVLNWFINRQHEIFEFRLIVGIVLSVLGGVTLSLSTDFVATHIPLPATVLEMIHWTWP